MKPQEVADKVRADVEQRTGPLAEYAVECTTCETPGRNGPFTFKFKVRVGSGKAIHLEIHQATDTADPVLISVH
ncbi:hypothetical protein BV898_08546 [Hypsibius exemplaris]|uniref:Cystatin domain-containing protein n=1 Tax=Hypsibius exemplaris TaxID=2072580 RepID=A0A1W0WQ14_HYPEX|nr:hypothetical protein BV898_08546 [Hypsibius exemplaris]